MPVRKNGHYIISFMWLTYTSGLALGVPLDDGTRVATGLEVGGGICVIGCSSITGRCFSVVPVSMHDRQDYKIFVLCIQKLHVSRHSHLAVLTFKGRATILWTSQYLWKFQQLV